TFSKGRHNGWGYVPEREIARLFEPAVKAVTLDEEIIERLQDGVSIFPKYRKPFDIIAEGLSPLNWLPFVNEYRTVCSVPSPEMKAVFTQLIEGGVAMPRRHAEA